MNILKEKYDAFKKSSQGNVLEGIQNKVYNGQIIRHPYFDLTFKDLNKEQNILRNIKSQNKTNDGKIDQEAVNIGFTQVYFTHHSLNQIYKEFFDKTFLKNKLSYTLPHFHPTRGGLLSQGLESLPYGDVSHNDSSWVSSSHTKA